MVKARINKIGIVAIFSQMSGLIEENFGDSWLEYLGEASEDLLVDLLKK